MAKPGRQARSADIAQVGALIFRRPDAGGAGTGDGVATPDASAAAGQGTGTGATRVPGAHPTHHPATAERTDRRTRRDVFDLDPRRVVERGPYIREWDEQGEEFERLVAAVRARGEIDTPIWVRSHGPTGQREFVLVAGKGRLRAALRNGLPTVPVRDLGDLDDAQAVARQVEENLNREDMTPAETAHALWRMHGFGESISEIGRRLHRDKGYVSYMVRVGEAVDALGADDQARLARRGALQVRQCQTIGALPDVAQRVAALRQAIAAGGAEGADAADRPARAAAIGPADGAREGATRRADEQAAFYGRPIRNGRTFRMRWVEQELRADPAAVVDGFVRAIEEEREQLVEALRRLETDGRTGEERDVVTRARRALERGRGRR
ncbi:MAG TPA: ParB N-terminal domain-containing protein [Gemmatirosa sp.]